MYLRNTLAFNSDNGNNVAINSKTKVEQIATIYKNKTIPTLFHKSKRMNKTHRYIIATLMIITTDSIS